MKPVIAFDPALLAVPNSAKTSVEAEGILARIIEWAQVAESQNFSELAIPSNTVAVLQQANCFPATHHIRALLEMFELDHVFSPNDINSRVFSLIQRASTLIDAIGVEVVESSEMTTDDVDFTGGASPELTLTTLHLLASICVCTEPEMVRVVLGFAHVHSPVRVVGTVTKIEKSDTGVIEIDLNSREVAGDVDVVVAPRDYLGSLSPRLLWERAESNIELHAAISLEAAALASKVATSLPAKFIREFCVGECFLESLRRNEAHGDRRFSGVVQQRCAQVVMDAMSANSFDVIRESDGAESFRAHVGKRHEALRLMYWRRHCGTIEFANIGPKSELIILMGDPSQKIIARFN